MSFSVSRRDLHGALTVAASIASRRTTIPIHSTVLLDANGVLRVSATDLQVAYVASIRCDADEKSSLAVPAKVLLDAVSSLAGDSVTVSIKDTTAELRAKKSKLAIPGFDAKQFPRTPDVADLKFHDVAVEDLRSLVHRVAFACDGATTNEGIRGIYINLANGTAMAANGLCGAIARVEKTVDALPAIQVPLESVKQLLKAFEDDKTIGVAVKGQELYARTTDALVALRLFEMRFPVDQLSKQYFRGKSDNEAICPRALLSDTVERVSLMAASDSGLPIDFKIEQDTLSLRAARTGSAVLTTAGGSAEDSLDCTTKGDDIEWRMDARMTLSALASMSCDEVTIGAADPLSAICITPTGKTDEGVAIAPMRKVEV